MTEQLQAQDNLKFQFIGLKKKFDESENLKKINPDDLTADDWKIFEFFLNFEKNYERDIKLGVELKTLASGLTTKLEERLKKIEEEDRKLDEKESSSYLIAFIKGQIQATVLESQLKQDKI